MDELLLSKTFKVLNGATLVWWVANTEASGAAWRWFHFPRQSWTISCFVCYADVSLHYLYLRYSVFHDLYLFSPYGWEQLKVTDKSIILFFTDFFGFFILCICLFIFHLSISEDVSASLLTFVKGLPGNRTSEWGKHMNLRGLMPFIIQLYRITKVLNVIKTSTKNYD